jgi:hypothetical protein
MYSIAHKGLLTHACIWSSGLSILRLTVCWHTTDSFCQIHSHEAASRDRQELADSDYLFRTGINFG